MSRPFVPSSSSKMQNDFFTFTVGKLDAGMAILIGERASLIEFPSLLLPTDVVPGSVVNISVNRNVSEERKKKQEFDSLQDDILETFGTRSPEAPVLRLRNVTQTSATLEWSKLQLHTATLLSLDIYRNSSRLATIPNALSNTSTKLSGLDVAAEYTFHLVLRTTAGTFTSNVLRTKTHDMTDTRGISVCFGSINDPALEEASKKQLEALGARWSDKILIETTHFVCTAPADRNTEGATAAVKGAMYSKAVQLNIPVVQPHWIFACKEQKRMVPISSFYLDTEPPNVASVRNTIASGLAGANRSDAASVSGQSGEAQTPSEVPNIDASAGAGTEEDEDDDDAPPPPAEKDNVPPLAVLEAASARSQANAASHSPTADPSAAIASLSGGAGGVEHEGISLGSGDGAELPGAVGAEGRGNEGAAAQAEVDLLRGEQQQLELEQEEEKPIEILPSLGDGGEEEEGEGGKGDEEGMDDVALEPEPESETQAEAEGEKTTSAEEHKDQLVDA